MSNFSVREILMVLALLVVSTNWALDHWTQVKWREEWLRNLATERSHDPKVQSLGFQVEHQQGK